MYTPENLQCEFFNFNIFQFSLFSVGNWKFLKWQYML